MGSPIYGTVADIYLQKLEKHILPLNRKVIFWKRYVDVFAIIELIPSEHTIHNGDRKGQRDCYPRHSHKKNIRKAD